MSLCSIAGRAVLLYADAGVWVAQQVFRTHPAQSGGFRFSRILTR